MSVNPSAAPLPHRPSRNCLLLLCGIPGAGKSTIASTLADSLGSGIDVVNYDSFLHAAMTADVSLDRENSLLGAEEGGVDSPAVFTAQAWHLSRQAAHNRVSELMSSTAPNSGHMVVVDDNMFYRSMRRPLHKTAVQYDWSFIQLHINVSIEVAVARDLARDGLHSVGASTIQNMAAQFQCPHPQGHFWERDTIVIDSGDRTSVAFLPWLPQLFCMWESPSCLSPPAAPTVASDEDVAASRQQTSTSVLHQADLRLRSCVSEILSDPHISKADKQAMAKRLQSSKKRALADLATLVEEMLGGEGDMDQLVDQLVMSFLMHA